MREITGQKVKILDVELQKKANENRSYLLSLTSENLLLNHQIEAGRATNNSEDFFEKIHNGWDAPLSFLRGHFLGHWLSAAALEYDRTGDRELLAKAMSIVDELEICQAENGEEWVAAIPEKYFTWLSRGKCVGVPHYVVHKTFMGLLDIYLLGHYEKALHIADKFADWFVRYAENFSREEFDDILDVETGGMLEIWAILLEITGKEKYHFLLERYYRQRLFDPLLNGEDPLTNMHANTTIPEIIGCAKAYEVTGDEKWRMITEAYWECAVTQRGTFATGGQTSGEVWTPKKKLSARLGDKNQEHCTVYNMMRLAGFLFCWTKDPKYADYIEKNLYNGVMAQTYWTGSDSHGQVSGYPQKGLLTYFLPMRAGGRKGWAGRTKEFFCCHGSMVQANAIFNHYIYYQEKEQIYVNQYFDSSAELEVNGNTLFIEQKEDALSGKFQFANASYVRPLISPVTSAYSDHPDCKQVYFTLKTQDEVYAKINFRIPEWAAGETQITINGSNIKESGKAGTYVTLERVWKDGDTVGLTFVKYLRTIPLDGDSDKVAFAYGPLVLAGLCEQEKILYGNKLHAEDILEHSDEREWETWKNSFQTKNQDVSIRFVPIKDIGYEPYTLYFPVRNKI